MSKGPRYDVAWKPSVLAKVQDLPKRVRSAIGFAIYELQLDPTRHGVVKLTNEDDEYRYRTGDYRIIFTVNHGKLYIRIVGVGHRREVYR